jgi:CheY-like chemotaxis protein
MKKILIIDDSVEFKEMICDYFQIIGYKVEKADNGTDGFKKALDTEKPDIIFLDVMMPDLSGIEVLRRLREEEKTKNIPVLILTGSNFDSNMNELFKMESNCRDFLSKSISLPILAKLVKNIIGE